MPEVKEIQQKMGVKHLTSEGMYEEILPGVNVHYTLQSQRLKENIRLKTAQAAEQELIFHLRYTDMEMKKEEDGSLGLYSENQRIFWFDKPYSMMQRSVCTGSGTAYRSRRRRMQSYCQSRKRMAACR